MIEITDEAVATISKMRDSVIKIGEYFGFKSEDYLKALESLNTSLVQMINLGGRITKDGELGLFGVNDYIAYGVVFHQNRSDENNEFVPKRGTWSVNS